MTVITAAASRAYLDGVRLAKPPSHRPLAAAPPVTLETEKAQALVVGSGLVLAGNGVAKDARQDVVDCTLFAQLAASGAVGDASKMEEWYAEYFRALTMLGWAQTGQQLEEFESRSASFEAHKAIIQVVTALLGPAATALAVVKTALDALRSMEENSPWITLFEKQSVSASTARFQVATAELVDGDLLRIALTGFSLKSRSRLTQVLFFKFKSSSVRLRFASGTATIYDEVLATQRERVRQMLDDYRAAYIGQVKFPPPPR